MLIFWNFGILVLPLFLLCWYWMQLNKGIKKFQKKKESLENIKKKKEKAEKEK